MQWLIDIILELIQPMLAALKVTIHGQLGYFNRGNAPVLDFGTGDFTKDNNWHTLDLSAIVPADARAVLVYLRLRSPTTGVVVRFSENGAASSWNTSITGILIANLFHWSTTVVNCDSNRHIQYRTSAVVWTNLDFAVAGWWLR